MNCQMIRVISSPSSSTTGSDDLDLRHAGISCAGDGWGHGTMERLPARVRGQDYSTSRDRARGGRAGRRRVCRDRTARGLACWPPTGERRRAPRRHAAQPGVAGSARTRSPTDDSHDRNDMSQDNPDKAAGSPEPDATTAAAPRSGARGDDRRRRGRRRVAERAASSHREPDRDERRRRRGARRLRRPRRHRRRDRPEPASPGSAPRRSAPSRSCSWASASRSTRASAQRGALAVGLGFGIAVARGDHRRRPRLGRPLQPGRDARCGHRRPHAVEGRPALLARPARRRHPRGRGRCSSRSRRRCPALITQDPEATAKSFFSGVANGFGEHSPLSTASQGQVEFSLVIGAAHRARRHRGVRRRHPRRDRPPVRERAGARSPSASRSPCCILVAMPVTNAVAQPGPLDGRGDLLRELGPRPALAVLGRPAGRCRAGRPGLPRVRRGAGRGQPARGGRRVRHHGRRPVVSER